MSKLTSPNQINQDSLYALQTSVYLKLQNLQGFDFSNVKLCGGTALARCWLNHRISYVLDFFLDESFSAISLAKALRINGIQYDVIDMVDDTKKANQLHTQIHHNGQSLKVSFIEDSYFDLYPIEKRTFGSIISNTESIAGLYHRKLRTISGPGASGSSFEGGRQKARDVFDLFVLAQSYMPLSAFIQSLPYAFPEEAFINGLISMPWFSIADELNEIMASEQWMNGKDIQILQHTLYSQIGATPVEENTIQTIRMKP